MADVREATESDLDGLLAAYEWLFAPPGSTPPAWDPKRAREALGEAIGSDHSAVIVADQDGRIVGFISAYLDLNSVRYGLRCWVEDLAVSPEHRSRGAGKALLDAAKDWARERDATHLELDSGLARTEAHRFYGREQPAWRGYQYTWEL